MMNSSLYFSAKDMIFCKGLEYLDVVLPEIILQLKEHGYCVVQMWDLTETPLIALRDALGRGQLHIRADHNGVLTIAPKTSPNPHIDESQYLGIGSQQHSPHTDGAYLNGLLHQDGVMQRVGPPAVVLIQCVRSALAGGSNIVIDAQRILRDLLTHCPDVARILLSQGCVSFCRDDHMALDSPVYERLSADRWRVRFRCDATLYAAEWAYEAIQHLYHHYLANHKYRQMIDLQEGQILLLDNFRVLHGREAFTGTEEHNRFFRRVWVCDDRPSHQFLNYCNTYNNCRALERYAFYGATAYTTQKPGSFIDLGIRIPHHLWAALDAHIPSTQPKAA